VLQGLRWYFRERSKVANGGYETPDPEAFDYAADGFKAPRFQVLYRRWLTDGDRVFDLVADGLKAALDSGAGRIEALVLPHQYRHSSVAVTEAHYAHLLKDDLVAASRQIKLPIAERSGANVVPMRRAREAQK
jgi:hypothetical protein